MASATPDVEANQSTEDAGRRRRSQAGGPGGDLHRLSRSGTSLYELLDIPKECTEQEIKKKYRRLALKYHPDKNPDNPEAEEKFKSINKAHAILTDEKKRNLYDKYGSFGLAIADQFGDDVVSSVMCISSKWFQCLFCLCGIFTLCYCCCCCLCCCACCGKCGKEGDEEDGDIPDVADLEEHNEDHEEPVTVQPQSAPTPMPMPMPMPDNADKPTPNEETPLNNEEGGPPPPSYDSVFGGEPGGPPPSKEER